MHELAIARSLVEAAEREADRCGAKSVGRLRCRIGALRQVDDWLLREAFKVARQGTLCAHSRLDVEKTELSALCRGCDVRFPVRDGRWHCPACGADGVGFSGGEELELVSIDVEIDDDAEEASENAGLRGAVS